MDDQQKPRNRDLSDLKARLGLKSGAKSAEAPGPPVVAPPPGDVPAPGASPSGGGADQHAAPANIGVTAEAPATAGLQPERRNPFQPSASNALSPAGAIDAGPPIDIPTPRAKRGPLLIGVIVLGLVGLIAGYSFGRIMTSRHLYNKTVDDAGTLRSGVESLAKAVDKVLAALAESRKRNANKVTFDAKLVEDLDQIQQDVPISKADKASKLQPTLLFKTNYALMDHVVVGKLFRYYSDVIRLLAAAEALVRHGTDNKDDLESFQKAGQEAAARKYGVVVADDLGSFYVGRLVEVGLPVCKDKKAKPGSCTKANQIGGWQIRGGRGKWSQRTGKEIKKTVIPIRPDELWRSVAIGKKGYVAFRRYLMTYQVLNRIGLKLKRDQKPLLQDLRKQANKAKIFAL